MNTKSKEVSQATAFYFKDICIGEYSGHMAMIPNNPIVQGLVKAHEATKSNATFADFLRQVADQISPKESGK